MELFWQTPRFPRATEANSKTAHMVLPDHSCRRASRLPVAGDEPQDRMKHDFMARGREFSDPDD
ncbi:hypothetical protein RBSH_03765 [Rhodopirellula baltica SH28]|uniref:Uncharacterized protein n=1 Tax=Rhodopirellula baltica SH28 TaxID=993517 RepID=K5DDN4_RHOBT|nr:hypothetical protein RBSH_03765 [Rhodopirellula baltica SH28]